MIEAQEYSQRIKDEADKLLQETKLTELLSCFGKTDLGGSYAYNLMVDRDLDFGGTVQSVTPELRAQIAHTFVQQPWAYSVNMTDRVNFEPLSNLGAPRGLFLGLTIPFPTERWNIDIWLTVGDKLPQDELAQRVLGATNEQKTTMLQIKYELMKSGQKEKGITSAEVYKAVLDKNIKTTEEFLKVNS